ncbi:MAG: hypothetical protein HYU56_05220 [Candidatus Aenigmarchaeota archaeon]|nr:hypothetical protein [Candidatus Aenigmarchaeota archaeon]
MKRKFQDIRNKIFVAVSKKPLSKMEIAKTIKADYRTVDKHLIWLIGTQKIKKIIKGNKVVYKIIQ